MKIGGHSFQSALQRSILPKYNCSVKVIKDIPSPNTHWTYCLGIRPVFAEVHFDWTLIQRGQGAEFNMVPIMMLHHPVERAISHFYYDQKMNFSLGWKMREQTIGEYFSDFFSMMETKLIWFDGQVSFPTFEQKCFCFSPNEDWGFVQHPLSWRKADSWIVCKRKSGEVYTCRVTTCLLSAANSKIRITPKVWMPCRLTPQICRMLWGDVAKTFFAFPEMFAQPCQFLKPSNSYTQF